MRERLTTNKTKIFVRECPTLMSVTKDEVRRHYNEIFDRLQEYEFAEEIGQIIVPPCKIGQTVYEITPNLKHIKEREVVGFHLGNFPTLRGHKRKPYLVCYDKISKYLKHIPLDRISKTVFLTKEEAEEALKGGVQG